MKLLVVRTTSFGDIIHTFPALSDAASRIDDLVCDWLVEDSYACMPPWHPAVRHVIPVSMRGWRRAPWLQHAPAIRRFVRQLRRERYDLVLDAQGLLKSALLARLARGPAMGLDRHSAGEAPAARLYHDTVAVEPGQHAIDRNRALFAGALGYDVPETMSYGLRLPDDPEHGASRGHEPYLVFIPGTTWPSKQWPESYWRDLTERATGAGWRVRINAGSGAERSAAERIAKGIPNVDVPPLSIEQLAHVLRGARAVVSVDSGPGHLAAAVGTPGVSIYGATDPALMGTRGPGQVHLCVDFECSPCLRRRCQFADRGQTYPDCYATVPPPHVWGTLRDLLQTC